MSQLETNASGPMDLVESIGAANGSADPGLLLRKYAVMRETPFSFMRGACQLFYSSLPDVVTLSGAPPGWLCGDLHAENFGTYKGDNRLTYFEVNDFDESALGPVTLDLVRFLASLLVGAREWGISNEDGESLIQRALLAYCQELALGKPSWIERDNARGAVKRLFAQVSGRSRNELLNRFTTRKAKRRRLVLDDVRLLSVTSDERSGVEQMMDSVGEAARDPDYFRVVDVAHRIAGVSSVAYPRFIALVEGRGSPDRNVLIDIKTAHASALGTLRASSQPAWSDYADRLVTVQRHSAVVAPAFLFPARWNGQSFATRELQPQEDRLRLQSWEKQPRKIAEAIVIMASVAAWLHLRGGGWLGSAPVEQLSAFGRESAWRSQLLELARDAADRTLQQYSAFCTAYDQGTFAARTPPVPESR